MSRKSLVTLAVVCLSILIILEGVAISVLIIQNAKQNLDIGHFKDSARIQCLQSKRLAPVVERVFEPLLTKEEWEAFRSTLPKECPK